MTRRGEASRRLIIAGEGPDELGRWYRETPYRHVEPGSADVPGLLEALLDKMALLPSEIVDGATWKRVPLFRAGDRRAPETRRVLGLAALAVERRADAVVFVRDRDGDEDREADIEAGLEQARTLGFTAELAGGVAVEEIEAWLLALLGDRRAETFSRPKETLAEKHGIRTRAQKVAVVEGADLDAGARRARSLSRFCEWVRTSLSAADDDSPSSG